MNEKKDHDLVGYVPDEEQSADPTPNQEKEIRPQGEAKKKAPQKKSHHHLRETQENLKKALAERDEMKDKYLRTLAEMDNFQKRMKREKEEFQKFILSDCLLELLPILDNLERALKTKNSENNSNIITGIEMIKKQFVDFLKKYQVVEIEALGKPFDPNFHQALAKEERADILQPTIVEIYQKGFTYQNKLLRPALTKVAVPAETAEVMPPLKEDGQEHRD